MLQIRRSAERGHANHGWLDTYHSFSFGEYHDPAFMGFRSLRVINEDFVAAGEGFGMHPHRDMEILTYVLEGALEHRDSMGNRGIIRPGEIQHMSAGTGVRHSEFNASAEKRVHLLQIWIMPERVGLRPEYEQKPIDRAQAQGQLLAIAAPAADAASRNGAVPIHQDAKVYATLLDAGQKVEHKLDAGRHAWLQVARGAVEVNGRRLNAGDGAALSDEPWVKLAGASDAAAKQTAEILLFDLA